MPVRRQSDPPPRRSNRRPATTPEGQEARMVALAEEMAAEQMRNRTASAQVVTHYLKMGSLRERLERERMQAEIELQRAKIEAIASNKRIEEKYAEAMKAFRGYQGVPPEESDDQDVL